jgi:hypothetical protein
MASCRLAGHEIITPRCPPGDTPGRRGPAWSRSRAPLSPLCRGIHQDFFTNVPNPAVARLWSWCCGEFVPPGAPLVTHLVVVTTVHVTLA